MTNEEIRKANSERAKEVAQAIAAQIGKQALFLLGAKNLSFGSLSHDVYGSPLYFLGFKIPRPRTKRNYIRIALEGSDTYLVQFLKVDTYEERLVCEREEVYADMLHDVIEDATGLYTYLGKKR